jgi:type I restriction enzyme M protein
MPTTTHDIVAKLWNLCNVLKDDGVTYHQYVSELTYLLFLKMAQETGREEGIPAEWRWDELEKLAGTKQLNQYKLLLLELGGSSPLVQEIYANASSFIKKPVTLNRLVSEIDKLDWYSARQEGLGDLYEGLLQKNAEEKKSGAGQYFTPRPLIDSMVAVMQPQLGDVIQDPAAGTGGFLIAAQRWIREHQDPSLLDEKQQKQFYERTFYGMEHVQDTHRLALMNLMLHGLDSKPKEYGILYGDTLSTEDVAPLPPATLILTNPPFGTKKGGGLPSRGDFLFPTSNKQFCFLQHI